MSSVQDQPSPSPAPASGSSSWAGADPGHPATGKHWEILYLGMPKTVLGKWLSDPQEWAGAPPSSALTLPLHHLPKPFISNSCLFSFSEKMHYNNGLSVPPVKRCVDLWTVGLFSFIPSTNLTLNYPILFIIYHFVTHRHTIFRNYCTADIFCSIKLSFILIHWATANNSISP